MKKTPLDKNLQLESKKGISIKWAIIWLSVTVWYFYDTFYEDAQPEPTSTYPAKTQTAIKQDSADLAQIAAQNNVKRYVKAQLNEPDSYEPVEFGDVLMYASRTEPYIIYHKWQAQNNLGNMIYQEYNFLLRKDMSVIREKPYPR